MLAGIAPVCLLVGGGASTVWLWLGDRSLSRRKEDEKSVKMSCPCCGVHVRFESERLGQQIDCPQCRKSMTLRGPENLKIACFFCKQHVEFPVHAIGEKVRCPHCKREIILKEPATG
jgi:DNA-directed RNA polymerase subunit RPC12/RpoP